MDSIVIALGGNALLLKGERSTFKVQMRNAEMASKKLAGALSKLDYGFVLTHGNGPQVGNELLRNFYAQGRVPRLPLSILNAETQAFIGSMIELALNKELKRLGSRKTVSTVITHVAVNRNDKAFSNPTKPVGPFYTEKELERQLKIERFKYVRTGGSYRRVVASPKPLEILEINTIRRLLKDGYGVICCGGGGVPVFKSKGRYTGADAVIDKDRTTALLASKIGAKKMIILTDVDYVHDDRKKPIHKIKAKELKKTIGDFEQGTMRPKLEACISFIENGGKVARIGNLSNAESVINGKRCTEIR